VASASDAHEVYEVDDQEWTLAPGSTVTVLDEAGPATLRQLLWTLHEPDLAALRDLSLRVYWEQASEPAIDLPLSVLYGVVRDSLGYETLPMSLRVAADHVELVWSWPMPFFEHARIELVNRGDAPHALGMRQALSRSAPDAASGHFAAIGQHRHGPMAAGERHLVAAISGRGKYVGTLLTMRGEPDPDAANKHPLSFLEGDETFVVDGRIAGQGTGTEDYFGAGWYFRDGHFATPFGALIELNLDDKSQTGSASAARFHLLRDAIEFDRSLELTFEYGADRPKTALEYTSVGFYYADQATGAAAAMSCNCETSEAGRTCGSAADGCGL
jgi:hypothetical protein